MLVEMDHRAHVKTLAASLSYSELRDSAYSQVVRWQWGDNTLHGLRPAYFELSKSKPGHVLDAEPSPPISGAHGYGFDAQDRIVVVRQQTSIEARSYETFRVYSDAGIASYYFDYSETKRWLNVEWFVQLNGRTQEVHAVYGRGNWISRYYDYDQSGRLLRERQVGTNPPFDGIDSTRELEHDEQGHIVRVFWCQPDGSRTLHFERPPPDRRFAACRDHIKTEITKALLAALTTVSVPVHALAFVHCGADCQHRLPPMIMVGTNADQPHKPNEREDAELELTLSPELNALCASASQDIWQNDRYETVNEWLEVWALELNDTALPIQRADDFKVFVTTLD